MFLTITLVLSGLMFGLFSGPIQTPHAGGCQYSPEGMVSEGKLGTTWVKVQSTEEEGYYEVRKVNVFWAPRGSFVFQYRFNGGRTKWGILKNGCYGKGIPGWFEVQRMTGLSGDWLELFRDPSAYTN